MRTSRWAKVLLTSIALCLYRELERITVARAVATWRRFRDIRDGVFLGPVIVRGARLPAAVPSSDSIDDSDDELDCIICSGQNDMLQSVTSLSSQVTGTTTDLDIPVPSSPSSYLGPLEAFCTIAPTKHVAHRECFLRWHSAYESQRHNRMSETVSIPPTSQVPYEDDQQAATAQIADIRRARALLKSAGFAYLIASIRPASAPQSSSDSSERWTTTRERTFQPSFTLFPPKGSSSRLKLSTSHNSTRLPSPPNRTSEVLPPTNRLATLRTQCPPCPGCRSAVELHFCASSSSSRERTRSRSRSSSTDSSWTSTIKMIAAEFAKEGATLVTGRTIAMGLSTQLSFLFTMFSMAHAREHGSMPPRAAPTVPS